MRYVGIWIMAGAAAGVGFLAADRVKDRLELLQVLKKMMYHLKNRIMYANATLPEAVWEVGERFVNHGPSACREMGRVFCEIWELLEHEENINFSEAWDMGVSRIPKEFPLTAADRQNLRDLGEQLGYADRKMQERTILFYLEQAEDTIGNLKRDVEVRGKLYRSLGLACGLFLVIFLS